MDNKVYIVFILKYKNSNSECISQYIGGAYDSLDMAIKAIKDNGGEAEEYNPGNLCSFYNKKEDKLYLVFVAPIGYPIDTCHVAKYED